MELNCSNFVRNLLKSVVFYLETLSYFSFVLHLNIVVWPTECHWCSAWYILLSLINVSIMDKVYQRP